MKTIKYLFVSALFFGVGQAYACDPVLVGDRAVEAVKALVSASGGGATGFEVESLSKDLGLTKGLSIVVVKVSYSGVQKFWSVTTSQYGCQIESITRMRE